MLCQVFTYLHWLTEVLHKKLCGDEICRIWYLIMVSVSYLIDLICRVTILSCKTVQYYLLPINGQGS